MHSVYPAHNSTFSANTYKHANSFRLLTIALGFTPPPFLHLLTIRLFLHSGQLKATVLSALHAPSHFSLFSHYTACKYPSASGYSILQHLQSPIGKWRYHFATLAKPLRQVATPFYNTCKTLSASGDTPLQQMQSPVGMWLHPFTTVVMHFNQLFSILKTQNSELISPNQFP